jgi:hypothetical protein
VLDVTKEYYSSESVAVWAPWFMKENNELFKKEAEALENLIQFLDSSLSRPSTNKFPGIRAQYAATVSAYEICQTSTDTAKYPNSIPNREAALKASRDLLTTDTVAKEVLQRKLDELARLKDGTPGSVTDKGITRTETDLKIERDNTLPARIKEINTTIAANEKAFPDSKTQAKVTAALKVNNGKIAANQKVIDNNIANLIPAQEKIMSDITTKYGVVEMPPAVRVKLNTATKAKEKLLNQNVALVGNEAVAAAYVTTFKAVVSNKTLSDKNTAILTTFDTNTTLRTERDMTIQNRIKEINARLLDPVVINEANPVINRMQTYNSEVSNLAAEIAKLPTLEQYDEKIATGKRWKNGQGGVEVMQAALAKILTDC